MRNYIHISLSTPNPVNADALKSLEVLLGDLYDIDSLHYTMARDQAASPVTEPAKTEEPAKPKRTRRTKAQIEADKKAKADAKAAADTKEDKANDIFNTGDDDDAFDLGDNDKDDYEVAEPATMEAIVAAATEATKVRNVDSALLMEILNKFSVKRLSKIPEDKFEEALGLIEAL